MTPTTGDGDNVLKHELRWVHLGWSEDKVATVEARRANDVDRTLSCCSNAESRTARLLRHKSYRAAELTPRHNALFIYRPIIISVFAVQPEKRSRKICTQVLPTPCSDLEKQTFSCLCGKELLHCHADLCHILGNNRREGATRVSQPSSAMASQGIGRCVASAREHCPPLCISNPVVIPSCFPAILGASSFFLLSFLSRSVGNTPCIPTPSYVPALSAEERVKSARDWVH